MKINNLSEISLTIDYFLRYTNIKNRQRIQKAMNF